MGGEDHCLVETSVALGDADVDAVDGLIRGGDGFHLQLLTTGVERPHPAPFE